MALYKCVYYYYYYYTHTTVLNVTVSEVGVEDDAQFVWIDFEVFTAVRRNSSRNSRSSPMSFGDTAICRSDVALIE